MASQMNKTMPLGHGQTDQGRMDRIMAMIEKEPVYAESSEALGQYKQAVARRNSGFFGRHFKKIAIAAALILALGITPFGGTTFAGELIHWANQVMIKTSGGFIEGTNSFGLGQQTPDFVTIEITTLEETATLLGQYCMDLNTIPVGYAFEKAIQNVDREKNAFILTVLFKDAKGETLFAEFSKAATHRPRDVPRSDFGMRVSGQNIKYSEVSFLDEKAMLADVGDNYLILPPNYYVMENGEEFVLNCSLSYASEGHQAVWTEGISFLEQWYTLITKP